MRKRRIAILLHKNASETSINAYMIKLLADKWRENDFEVVLLFGCGQFIPADILFIHVDLSIVPNSYFKFAARYPVVINGGAKDIRKSKFSKGLLRPNDDWDGPVIVKSDKNYGGRPERRRRRGLRAKIGRKMHAALKRLNLNSAISFIKTPLDYRIYHHLREVPRLYFYHPGLVIQKFKPEMDNGLYCVRHMIFLGDHLNCTRLKAPHPIVNGHTSVKIENNITPHPRILALREQFSIDYGKFDYVIVNGQAILLDINKTVGCPPPKDIKCMGTKIQYLAKGLYEFMGW